MINHCSFQLIAVFLIWTFPLTSCDRTNAGWTDDAQFIYYNGTISGSYTFNNGNFSNCRNNGAYYFAGLNNSLMRIGVTPPWDSNPFWFELGHIGNDYQDESSNTVTRRQPLEALTFQERSLKRGVEETSAEKRDFCVSLGGCTYDAIYNLEFATSWYACQQVGGNTCPYHVSAEMVNLKAASVSTVSSGVALANGDDSAFYSVKGDESTWVGNWTVDYNMFNFQIPRNYSSPGSGCRDPEATFNWNDAKYMTYNVNFTNKTAVSQFTVTSNTSTVTLFFSGTRDDGDIMSDDAWKNRPNNGRGYVNTSLDTIQLADPRSHPLPHFTLTNGKAFNFSYSKEDGWTFVSGSSTLFLRDGVISTSIWLVLGSLVITLLSW